jgi:hypothetical protein
MEIGEDFILRDDLESINLIPVELKVAPYEKVVYEYQDMRIVEDPTGENPPILQFKYNILDPAGHDINALEETDLKFREVVGLILNSMLLTIVEADLADAARENNINESNTQ